MIKTCFKITLLLVILLFYSSCKKDVLPKPKAYLSLNYPKPEYVQVDSLKAPIVFQKNKLATSVLTKTLQGSKHSYGVNLEYPSIKGTVYLTYKSIDKPSHLITYLKDAQNFTLEHTRKADEITEQLYHNKTHNVYGMFYEVGGNAASQSQFYITDSINHFLVGSLYFYAKPNYDSILPAAHYLKDDIKHLMETLKWK